MSGSIAHALTLIALTPLAAASTMTRVADARHSTTKDSPAAAATSPPATTAPDSFHQADRLVPVRRFEPSYPEQGAHKFQQGCVLVGFDVTPPGRPVSFRQLRMPGDRYSAEIGDGDYG